VKVVEIAPKNVSAYCNLGFDSGKIEQFPMAAAAFRKTIELEPTSALGHYGLAQALKDLGKHQEVIAEYEWIVRELEPGKKRPDADMGNGLDSKYLHARVRLAESLFRLGRFADASAAAHRALDLPGVGEADRKKLWRQIEIGRQLVAVEANIRALLAGNQLGERLAGALWPSMRCDLLFSYFFPHFPAGPRPSFVLLVKMMRQPSC
jgi:tetratricopeptide (TPR) repeat protein